MPPISSNSSPPSGFTMELTKNPNAANKSSHPILNHTENDLEISVEQLSDERNIIQYLDQECPHLFSKRGQTLRLNAFLDRFIETYTGHNGVEYFKQKVTWEAKVEGDQKSQIAHTQYIHGSIATSQGETGKAKFAKLTRIYIQTMEDALDPSHKRRSYDEKETTSFKNAKNLIITLPTQKHQFARIRTPSEPIYVAEEQKILVPIAGIYKTYLLGTERLLGKKIDPSEKKYYGNVTSEFYKMEEEVQSTPVQGNSENQQELLFQKLAQLPLSQLNKILSDTTPQDQEIVTYLKTHGQTLSTMQDLYQHWLSEKIQQEQEEIKELRVHFWKANTLYENAQSGLLGALAQVLFHPIETILEPILYFLNWLYSPAGKMRSEFKKLSLLPQQEKRIQKLRDKVLKEEEKVSKLLNQGIQGPKLEAAQTKRDASIATLHRQQIAQDQLYLQMMGLFGRLEALQYSYTQKLKQFIFIQQRQTEQKLENADFLNKVNESGLFSPSDIAILKKIKTMRDKSGNLPDSYQELLERVWRIPSISKDPSHNKENAFATLIVTFQRQNRYNTLIIKEIKKKLPKEQQTFDVATKAFLNYLYTERKKLSQQIESDLTQVEALLQNKKIAENTEPSQSTSSNQEVSQESSKKEVLDQKEQHHYESLVHLIALRQEKLQTLEETYKRLPQFIRAQDNGKKPVLPESSSYQPRLDALKK